MISILKMDLYRMFKTKSMYILWGIMIFIFTFTSYIAYSVDGVYTENAYLANTKMDILASLEGMINLFPIFIAVFTTIFTTADMSSGYIKNIASQISNRSILIFSKAFSMLVYTIMTAIIFFFTQLIVNKVFLGYIYFNDTTKLLQYLGMQILLNLALSVLCISYCMLIRKSGISMTIAVATAVGFIGDTVVYPMLDAIARELINETFQAYKFGLTGNIFAVFFEEFTNTDIIRGIIVAICFLIASTLTSCIVFKKRDIV